MGVVITLVVLATLAAIIDNTPVGVHLYERIGEERTFEVDLVPPQLFKRLIVRPKYRHALDRSRPPLVAPAPKRRSA